MSYHHRRESHVHVPLKRPASSATNEGDGDDSLSSLQHIQIQCEEWIDFHRLQHLINGIDYSIPPTLMKQSLVKIISLQCGFKHRPNRLLGRHVPPNSGNMNLAQPEDIVQSFQIYEDRYGTPILSDANQAMETCLDHVFSTLFCHHLSAKYPLIFSQSYVEKLTNNTKHIPIVARSLQRTMATSGAASRSVFNDKATDYLQITRNKIKTLQTSNLQQRQEHGGEDGVQADIWNDLVMATYYFTKRSDSLRRHRTTVIKAKPPTNATQTSTSSSWDSVVSTTDQSEETL
ncbi:hypothetical protein [Absidia glauca]|uniref:Uncharacterized protein n=1 Tax=Absidia glauca TaxID=4829 RepID=A0A163JXM4_ABSGL|nr:hypothetical protein [Absidia glauca]